MIGRESTLKLGMNLSPHWRGWISNLPMTTSSLRGAVIMSEVQKVLVLDAGVLLALALGEPSTEHLTKRMPSEENRYACTELGLTELTYILCRKLDWKSAWHETENLIRSSVVRIIPTGFVWREAAKIKCQVPIALPDCFTIGASRVLDGLPVFARKEAEIVNAIETGLLTDDMQFLE
ncbi:MAG: PIN domain-containing protein [Candidatus Lokiarchaeota archaeon]|nr:PIN domain-containing protein [Candidatus Lokiarchaeota archaeon]